MAAGALTPLAIAALSLLNERPMHPYEMYQVLLERHEHRMIKIRPGSLYHTVERLRGAELVEVVGTDREGNRPERTTFAITPAGKTALVARIRDVLRTPIHEYPIFPVALGEAHEAAEEEVIDDLTAHAADLTSQLDELSELLAAARGRGIPEAYLIAADYLLTTTTAQRDWILRCASRLQNKELTWPQRP